MPHPQPPEKPTLIFVPGFWEPPSIFSNITHSLESLGYTTLVIPLPSTGKLTPSTPSPPLMLDDVAAIRAAVSALVEDQYKTVIVVLHSAGGFLGSMAVEGMVEREREVRGLKVGVKGIVGLTAGFWPVGHVGGKELPFAEYRNGGCYPKDPRNLLFNDISSATEVESLISQLKPQPACSYDAEVTYTAWAHVPVVYLLCQADQVIIPEWQRMFVENARARVVECDAGHMPMVSRPEEVVKCVVGAVEEWERGGGGADV